MKNISPRMYGHRTGIATALIAAVVVVIIVVAGVGAYVALSGYHQDYSVYCHERLNRQHKRLNKLQASQLQLRASQQCARASQQSATSVSTATYEHINGHSDFYWC